MKSSALTGVGGADLLQSRTIDFLRFPLVFLVVFIHSFGEPLSDDPGMGIFVYDNIRILFSHIIGRLSVPAFYLISGYLFFYRLKEFNGTIYRQKLKSRLKTVLIPYLLWNLLWLAYQIVSRLVGGVRSSGFDGLGEIKHFFESNGWLNCLWSCNVWPYRISWFAWDLPSSGPILIPMWFLRDLMVAFLLTYPMYKLIRKLRLSFLLLMFFCFVSGLWPNIPGLSVDCLMFFAMGAYMSINGKNMINEFSRYAGIVLPITLVLLVLLLYFKSDFTISGLLIYPFFLLFGVLSIFIITAWLLSIYPHLSAPGVFVRSSFFIYASHTFLILWYCTIRVHKIIPQSNILLSIISYFLIPLFTTIVCLLLFLIIGHIAPRYLAILSGNRSIIKN